MKSTLFSVVGSTASGKTALALGIASFFSRENKEKAANSWGIVPKIHLLSADSRQVYQGLEELSAADIPINWQKTKLAGFSLATWKHPRENIYFHGISIISPKEEWSVAHFFRLFQEIQKNLKEGDLLIIVGGTAFYQKQLQNAANTLSVPSDPKLRQELQSLHLEQLQTQLALLDPAKLSLMNNSDLHNPRRLIRAIEVARYLIDHGKSKELLKLDKKHKQAIPCFFLSSDKEIREKKIRLRVEQRFDQAIDEVKNWQELYKQKAFLPAFSSSGFQELSRFLDKEITREETKERWVLSEIQYGKRQDTWWKKYPNLTIVEGESLVEQLLFLKEALS